MPAEPAAAPDVSGATESIQSAEQPQTEEQLPAASPIGARAQALLDEMEVPRDVQESLQPKTERPNADKKFETEIPGGPESPERVDGGHPEGGEAANAKRPTPNAQRPTEEEEKPLTDDEKSSWPPEALNRIHKLTAKKSAEKAARVTAERIAVEQNTLARQLHAQLQDKTRVRPAPTREDPLADVFTAQDLQRAVQENEELLEWAKLNRDGVADVVIGKDEAGNPITRSYTAQEIAKIEAGADRLLRNAVPAKAGWLQEQQMHEQYARATLPEMFQEGTDEFGAIQQLQQHVPELFARLPGAQQWVAWALIGKRLVQHHYDAAAAQNGNGKTAVNGNGQNGKTVDPKVAPFLQNHPPMAPGVPFTGGGRSVERPSKDSARKQAVEKFTEAGGDDEALEDLVASTRRMQSQPAEALV